MPGVTVLTSGRGSPAGVAPRLAHGLCTGFSSPKLLKQTTDPNGPWRQMAQKHADMELGPQRRRRELARRNRTVAERPADAFERGAV